MLRLYRGETQPVPTVEEAENYPYTERERAIVEHNRGRTIAGAPDQVRTQLEELGRLYDIDEFVVVTICDRLEAQLRSDELLAEVFGLQSRKT